MKNLPNLIVLLLGAVSLYGCGGGGGSTSANAATVEVVTGVNYSHYTAHSTTGIAYVTCPNGYAIVSSGCKCGSGTNFIFANYFLSTTAYCACGPVDLDYTNDNVDVYAACGTLVTDTVTKSATDKAVGVDEVLNELKNLEERRNALAFGK